MNKNLLGLIGLLLLFTSCVAQPEQSKIAQNTENYTLVAQGGLPSFLQYPGSQRLRVSAHRGGGSYEGYPENCIESFEYTLSKIPAIIECDIRSTSDGVLVLLHDETLDRTTTGSGKLSEKTWKELSNLKLKDHKGNVTDFSIPTLEEALKWAKGKAILSLDVKRKISFEAVINEVRKQAAEDYVTIITYTLDAAKKVHQYAPNLVMSCSVRNDYEFDLYANSGIPWANIMAFVGTKEPPVTLYEKLHEKGVLCILGTMGNLDKSARAKGDKFYRGAIIRGADVIATDRPIEASYSLQKK